MSCLSPSKKNLLLLTTIPPVCPRTNIHKYYFEKLSSIITIMLVCPRCRTSNIRNRCSLSIHLAWYCTGLTLPSDAFSMGTSTSCIHDGQHPLSMATTSLQQARHFNAPEVNIALPTINTLHAMPSMSQLSSTHNNLTQSNLRYANSDDADYSQSNDNYDCFPVIGIGNILIEKCSFLRNSFRLPSDVAFQVLCVSVISQHRENDLNMFNQVMQCVSGHAYHRHIDFRTIHVMSRDQLLWYICQYYRLDFLKPTMHNVALSDGSVATVPIFDVKETILPFLNNPGQMRVENIAANYDPFTGKSTITNPP